MKHVGKMKNNGAKVAVVCRTLPGDAYHALVVGTGVLGESYHNSLMSIIEEPSGQQANELADILAVRNFPDGNIMLGWLHARGHLKKVPTDSVLMTPNPQTSISLDELNHMIAQQRGVSIDELAITDGVNPNPKPPAKEPIVETQEPQSINIDKMTPKQLRSKANSLFKEAQQLRRKADEIDPPKKKSTKVSEEVE
jgi:hypothetical protein